MTEMPHTLYRFWSGSTLLYIGMTSHISYRLEQHQAEKPWWHTITHITTEHYATRDKLAQAEKNAIRFEAPLHNVVGNQGRHLLADVDQGYALYRDHIRRLIVDLDQGTVPPNADPAQVAYAQQLRNARDQSFDAVNYAAAFRPVGVMQKVSEFIRSTPDGASLREIEGGVRGRKEIVSKAINCLVDEKYVKREHGPNRALIHTSLRPFVDSDIPTTKLAIAYPASGK